MKHPKNTSLYRWMLFSLVLCCLFTIPVNSYARDRIQIVGSSTVYPFATVVAERLGKKTSLKTPVIESTGTGGGMKLFCSGIGEEYPDITNASRKIKSSEIELCKKNGITEVVEVIIGNDGIALANSTAGVKAQLTRAQLWTAMAAKGPLPKTWKEIDPKLPDTKIEILTPPPTSGTRDAWNALVMEEGCDPKVKAQDKDLCALMREDGAVVEAGENDALIVQKLAANKDAFGIFGYSYLINNQDKIQPATIEEKEISLESIQDYSYPIARPLYFYIKKAHVAVIPGMKEYLDEFTSMSAMSPDGYLADIGLVPLDQKTYKEVRQVASNLTILTNS